MFPVAVIACGMSLLPLSDSNVRFWDLEHLGHLNLGIGPNERVSPTVSREGRENYRAAIIRDLLSVVWCVLSKQFEPHFLCWMHGIVCRELDKLRQLDEDAAAEEATRRELREHYEKELVRLPDFMHRMAAAHATRGIDPADFIWTHAIIASSLQKLGQMKAICDRLERDR